MIDHLNKMSDATNGLLGAVLLTFFFMGSLAIIGAVEVLRSCQ